MGLEMTSSNSTAIVGSSGALADSAIHVSLAVFLKSWKNKITLKQIRILKKLGPDVN